MKTLVVLVSLLGLALAGSALAASAPKAAPLYFAGNCANCHGTDGKGASAIPLLAGRDKAYLLEALRNFKSGARPATIMHQLSKGYTDEELELLADHYSRIK